MIGVEHQHWQYFSYVTELKCNSTCKDKESTGIVVIKGYVKLYSGFRQGIGLVWFGL